MGAVPVSQRLHVQLMGGVALIIDAERVELRGVRETALVARLALDAGVPVSSEVLLEDVWNGAPPASGTGALRVQVRRLRSLLADHGIDDVLRTVTGGYVLDIPPDHVDLWRCRSLVDDAIAQLDRPGPALAAFEEAADLWRGQPFRGLENFGFVAIAAGEIARSVRLTQRLYAEALVDAGRPAEAEAVLAPLVAVDPLDSELVVTSMRAARLAGRAHDALRLAQDHRAQLRDIGLFPNHRVVEEEHRSLVPTEPAAKAPELVGRERECHELGRLVNGLNAGHGGALLVEGVPGAGKTALLRWAATTGRQFGLEVVEARADSLETDVPLRLASELLRGFSATRVAVERAADSLVGGQLLAGAGGGTDVANWHRHGITSDIIATFEAELAVSTLLIVDDLHWADRSSLGVLRALVRLAATAPIAVVAAGRPASGTDGWHELLAADAGSAMVVGPLDPEQSVTLAARLVGGELEPSLADVIHRAAGLPLLIEELVSALRREERLTLVGGLVGVSGRDLPDSLQTIVGRLLGDVSPALRDLCAHAAVLGGRCRLDELAGFLGVSALTVARGVSDPSLGGILEVQGSKIAFRHDLVRDAVEQSVPEAVRSDMHRRAAAMLAEVGAPVTSVAAHAALASASEDDPQVVDWLHKAADVTTPLEPKSALRFLDRALEFTQHDGLARYRLQRARAEAFASAGETDEAIALLEMLWSLDEDRAGEVVLRLGGLRLLTGQADLGLKEVGSVLDTAGPPRVRSRLLALSALLSLSLSDLTASAAAATAANELAMEADDPVGRSIACGMLGRLHSLSLDLRLGIQLTRVSVELAEMDPTGEAHRYQPWLFHGLTAFDLDDHATVEAALDAGRLVARRQYAAWADPMYLALEASLHYRRGRLDAAAEAARAVLGFDHVVGPGPADAWAHAFLSLVELRRGRIATASDQASAAEEAFAEGRSPLGVDFVVLASALVREQTGDPAAALTTLRDSWDLLDSVGLRACLPLLAGDLARLSFLIDDRSASDRIADECATLATLTDIDAHRALALRVSGLLAGDPAPLRDACRIYESTERRLELEDCRAELTLLS